MRDRQNILSQKLLQKSPLYQDIQQDFCDDFWLKRLSIYHGL
jgi:hypothetical protein